MKIAIAAAAVITALCVGCFGPEDRRPGAHLTGSVVNELPEDWGFSDEFREIAIQVRTPYLIPHSVTIWCASVDGALYVGARDPESKRWPAWVDRDPRVRLRIGSDVYEVRLSPVDDEAALARIRGAYAAKYDLGDRPGGDPPEIRYWVVMPRG